VPIQGKEGVVDRLNQLLTNERTATNQSFPQAEMCENRGFPRLDRDLERLSVEEMKEAEEVMEHILSLEGMPNVQRLGQVRIGRSIQEHLEADLELEGNRVRALAEAIDHCPSSATTRPGGSTCSAARRRAGRGPCGPAGRARS
jgi:bacterioferritin